MRRWLATFVISALAVVALPGSAGGGIGIGILFIDLVSPTEPLTFLFTIEGEECVSGFEVETILDTNGNPVTPLSVTEDPSNPNQATVVLASDTVPGQLNATASCFTGEEQFSVGGLALWGSIAVTKTVVGTPPDGATFLVDVDCTGVDDPPGDLAFDGVSAAALPFDFRAELTYGATGGLAYVYSDHAARCSVSERDSGGATSVSIDPALLELDDPGAFAASVTNTFAATALVVDPTFTG